MPELFGANPFNLLPHLAALAVAYLLALPIGGRWAGRPSRGWRALTVQAFSPMSG